MLSLNFFVGGTNCTKHYLLRKRSIGLIIFLLKNAYYNGGLALQTKTEKSVLTKKKSLIRLASAFVG